MDNRFFLGSLCLVFLVLLGFGVLFGFFICGVCIGNGVRRKMR